MDRHMNQRRIAAGSHVRLVELEPGPDQPPSS
jgi:hypothetical protein